MLVCSSSSSVVRIPHKGYLIVHFCTQYPYKEVVMVYLYKFVDGEWRLVDYGVINKTDTYIALGYLVKYV